MEITVKFFARFKELAGTARTSLTVAENATIADLLTLLPQQFPNLHFPPEQTILAHNKKFAAQDTVLQNGDEVAIFPPVSGGTDQRKLAITHQPIDMSAVAQMVTHPSTGAVVVFTGVVRNESHGKAVTGLDYETYAEMAQTGLAQVAEEMRRQWPDLVDLAIVQRVGYLTAGEVAVVIAVSSRHRDQGCFEACRYGIDRLKEIVPVWKKELGPGGEEWIEGSYNPSLT